MDGAYALAAARCAILPEKYVPEIGWMTSMAPAVLAIPAVLVAFAVAARYPALAKGALVTALAALAVAALLSFLMLGADCPPLR